MYLSLRTDCVADSTSRRIQKKNSKYHKQFGKTAACTQKICQHALIWEQNYRLYNSKYKIIANRTNSKCYQWNFEYWDLVIQLNLLKIEHLLMKNFYRQYSTSAQTTLSCRLRIK